MVTKLDKESIRIPFELELGGRVLPNCERTDRPRAPQSHQADRMEASFAELGEFLSRAVRERLGKSTTVLNAVTLKEAVEIYAEQLKLLRTMAEEWKEFLHLLVLVEEQGSNVSRDHEYLIDIELEKWKTEIFADTTFQASIGGNVLTAELATKPIGLIKEQLGSHIRQLAESMSTNMRGQLVELVGLEMIGLIEWFDADKCTYSRYVRKCDVSVERVQELPTQRKNVNGRPRVLSQTLVEGKSKRSLVRTIQHLVQAKECRNGESKVVVPRDIRSYISSAPCWLAPGIRIVEGVLIRETVVEQDLGVQQFGILEDKVQWHSDPAVVLGPFVLWGWGEAEIRSEMELQAREQADELSTQIQTRPTRWPWSQYLGLVLLGVVSLLILSSTQNLKLLAAGTTLVGLASISCGKRREGGGLFGTDPNTAKPARMATASMLLGRVSGSGIMLIVGVPLSAITDLLFRFDYRESKSWGIAIEDSVSNREDQVRHKN